MKSLLAVVIVLWALPSAEAQILRESRGEGYLFVAPFVEPDFGGRGTYVAGGAEIFLHKGASIGAEVGPVITSSRDSGLYAFGLGSANVAYHFSRQSSMQPFLTAGYSATFRAGVAHGTNFGGGINFWQKKNLAIRFEFRAYVGRLRIDQAGPRFGVTFR
jgi:hypothetical protein